MLPVMFVLADNAGRLLRMRDGRPFIYTARHWAEVAEAIFFKEAKRHYTVKETTPELVARGGFWYEETP